MAALVGEAGSGRKMISANKEGVKKSGGQAGSIDRRVFESIDGWEDEGDQEDSELMGGWIRSDSQRGSEAQSRSKQRNRIRHQSQVSMAGGGLGGLR